MANQLQFKRRGTGQAAGAPASLKSGEVAYNMTDGILYIGFGDDGGGNATSIKAFAKDNFVDPAGLYQPTDADLTALAALSNLGLIARTGAGTVAARTITGTAGRTTVSNGDGVSGNPTFDLATVAVGSTTTGGSTKFTVDGYGRITNAGAASLTDLTGPTAAYSMNSQRVTNIADPTGPQDAATKFYVDSAIQGLDPKASVKAASTANVTISSAPATIDGVTLVANDRVLLKNQTAPAENGIYVFASAGAALVRATDMNAWTEVAGAWTIAEEGTTNADTAWLFTSNSSGTINTTAITVSAFGVGGAGGFTTAGNGLTGAGSTVEVGAGTGIAVSADAVALTGQALALHNVTTAADKIVYATGSATFATSDFTAWARSYLASINAAAARTTLGLGSLATQDSSNVTITGGTIDNIVLDGGTF